MSETHTIRVLAVDDHQLLRQGIRFSLMSVDDIELVAEAHSGEEALSLCDEAEPDVVLMDMRLSGDMDGVAATRAIRNHHPQVQVVALSSYFDRDLVQSALQSGAVGYLVKGVSVEELANAIRKAYAGKRTLADEAVGALVEAVEPVTPITVQLGHDLTEREREVLPLLAEGRTNAEIADQLTVSVAAVKYHVGGILSKLGASNRTEAAALAREHDLVQKREPRQDKSSG